MSQANVTSAIAGIASFVQTNARLAPAPAIAPALPALPALPAPTPQPSATAPPPAADSAPAAPETDSQPSDAGDASPSAAVDVAAAPPAEPAPAAAPAPQLPATVAPVRDTTAVSSPRPVHTTRARRRQLEPKLAAPRLVLLRPISVPRLVATAPALPVLPTRPSSAAPRSEAPEPRLVAAPPGRHEQVPARLPLRVDAGADAASAPGGHGSGAPETGAALLGALLFLAIGLAQWLWAEVERRLRGLRAGRPERPG